MLAAATIILAAWIDHQGMPPKDAIRFDEVTLQEALARAEAENKLVFVDVYASWCGPCKQLKRTTFADPATAALFNKTFVNLAVNGEKGDGPELMALYEVHAYPTLLFLRANGEVVERVVGYHSAEQLLKIAGKIIEKS